LLCKNNITLNMLNNKILLFCFKSFHEHYLNISKDRSKKLVVALID